jgi:hypothetical protein
MTVHFTGCLETKIYDWSLSRVSRDKKCMTGLFPGCLDKKCMTVHFPGCQDKKCMTGHFPEFLETKNV